MDDFRTLADALAADIVAGRLGPGERLPTQRRFARDRGIAVSTASRVYAELARRGLVVGEAGRGTFVRAGAPAAEPALAEPSTHGVDLELNFPVLPDTAAALSEIMVPLLRPDALAATLVPTGAAGTAAARTAAAGTFAREGWAPEPDRIRFAGNGRQAIAAAVAAVVGVGGRLGVEPLTYPVVRGIAARLGVQLVPLPVDADGVRPDDLPPGLAAVYVQPTLHNPLGTTMPPQRRAALAAALAERDLPCIEDTVWAFLRDGPPPVAAWAPEQTLVVDGLSKRVAPGLSAGIVVAPAAHVDRVGAALRSGGWTAPGFALAVATRAMAGGTVATLQEAKRRDAAARQRVAREQLAGFTVRADPAAYHCWWELPQPWRAETFVAAAARRGIAVTPAAAFTIGAAHAPDAVRLALAAPPPAVLTRALGVLADLARSQPGDDGVE